MCLSLSGMLWQNTKDQVRTEIYFWRLGCLRPRWLYMWYLIRSHFLQVAVFSLSNGRRGNGSPLALFYKGPKALMKLYFPVVRPWGWGIQHLYLRGGVKSIQTIAVRVRLAITADHLSDDLGTRAECFGPSWRWSEWDIIWALHCNTISLFILSFFLRTSLLTLQLNGKILVCAWIYDMSVLDWFDKHGLPEDPHLLEVVPDPLSCPCDWCLSLKVVEHSAGPALLYVVSTHTFCSLKVETSF